MSEGVNLSEKEDDDDNDNDRCLWFQVKLGPTFSTDQFHVRTKDNVELTLVVQYKWMFLLPRKDLGGKVCSHTFP